jgi:glycosyltransferase involved in cell wall biosynthesis
MNHKISIVTHVNPFSKGSGQVERVYNTILALAETWSEIEIFTIDENKSLKTKLEKVYKLNNNIKINYIKYKITKIQKIVFKTLPFFGYGKESNFLIPNIFKDIENQLANSKVVIFEYWHLYKMAKKLKDKGIFVVCDTHNILSNSFNEFISKKKWLPDFFKNFLKKRYYQLEFEKALKDNFNLVIAINKKEYNYFKSKLNNQHLYYCPMGINLENRKNKFNDFESKKIYNILYYGGLGSKRNEEAAFEVINLTLELSELVKLKVIGSNPSIQLKQKVKNKNNVELLGFVNNLEEAFDNIDLAIIPFKGKYGFRSRILELMHHNVPVLTTDDAVWGMNFLDNEDVFIYHNNSDLKRRAIELINNIDLRNKIIKNAKTKIEYEYSFEKTYLKFSNDLIKMSNL